MISYFQIKGRSMEPLCKEGDFVLLNKLSYLVARPNVGDTIILRHPQEKRLLLKYISREKMVGNQYWYWVEGINKHQSVDSRSFGWIARNMIIGKAIVVQKPRMGFSTGGMLRARFW